MHPNILTDMHLFTDNTIVRPIGETDISDISPLLSAQDTLHTSAAFALSRTMKADDYMQYCLDIFKNNGLGIGYLTDKNGQFLGCAGYMFVPEVELYEINYSLRPAGSSLTGEVVNGLLSYAFEHLNLDTICVRALPGDSVSAAVLRDNKFTYLGERMFVANGISFIGDYFEQDNDSLKDFATHNSVAGEDWELSF